MFRIGFILFLISSYWPTHVLFGQVDTSSVITSAVVRVLYLSGSNLTDDQVCKIIKQSSTISLIELKNIGFKDLLFFKLKFPEGGIPYHIEGDITTSFDPTLTQARLVFVYDLKSKDLFLLNENSTFSDDTLSFFYLVQHRTNKFYKNIYKKRLWLSNLSIEGVSMSWLWNKGIKLKRLASSMSPYPTRL